MKLEFETVQGLENEVKIYNLNLTELKNLIGDENFLKISGANEDEIQLLKKVLGLESEIRDMQAAMTNTRIIYKPRPWKK